MGILVSGLRFTADARQGATRYLHAGVEISAPFTESRLILRFPRWVPGSYMLREPLQFMDSITVHDAEGSKLKWQRIDVDGLKITIPTGCEKVIIGYRLLATMMSVRATHIDDSHLHLMPPFTWWIPESGIAKSRLSEVHSIDIKVPEEWSISTQLDGSAGTYTADGRDELLDGIIEANANPEISWQVKGIEQKLKIWDSGGTPFSAEMINKFIDKATLVIEEHYGLFGIPPWKDYLTIIHLTDSARGGLEHMRSQTSMVPRSSLWSTDSDEWRDLISLFSHEFLHQWNVKNLRPRNFLDYDLQKEVHTDLLWWFEGGTSWLGDLICLRSGAWDIKDWKEEWKLKIKRHLTNNGSDIESWQESSNDAWIHLYRPNSHARESRISYYLEGELALFCLDVELRKRSKGLHGLDEVMADLFHNHGLASESPGINHSDIRRAITSKKGCRRLGVLLDDAVSQREMPDLARAIKSLGMEMIPDKGEKGGWLGIECSEKNSALFVRTHLAKSPVRDLLNTGDEIIALDGIRINSKKRMNAYLKGKADSNCTITIARQGNIKKIEVKIACDPDYAIKLKGDGNSLWRSIIASRR
jgi:predicted metalloprotease with PDZ domain